MEVYQFINSFRPDSLSPCSFYLLFYSASTRKSLEQSILSFRQADYTAKWSVRGPRFSFLRCNSGRFEVILKPMLLVGRGFTKGDRCVSVGSHAGRIRVGVSISA